MRTHIRCIAGIIGATVAILAVFISGASSTQAQRSADNTLTEKERTAGWKLLFDGTTTTGWRGYQQKAVSAGWKVANGELTRAGADAGDIVTVDQYTDVELTLDWKIAPKGNSGIFYRGLETEERIYHTAPEYQLLDNDGHPDAKNGPDRTAGANYDLIAPAKQVCHPAGQWNTTRIVVRGPHVEHWLNGEKVVEYELWSPAWKTLVADSKFEQWPRYGLAKTGYIGLQDHGDEVSFKNIKIRVLK